MASNISLGPGAHSLARILPALGDELVSSGVLDVGGFKLTGIDQDIVNEASVRLHVPLNSGRFTLPADYDDAVIDVLPNTSVDVYVEANRGTDGKLLIRVLDMKLSRDLRIKNPAGAFEPVKSKDSFISNLGTDIKDAAADLLVRGTSMDSKGNIHLHGVIELPWFMPNEKLDKIIGRIDADAPRPSLEVPDHAVLTDMLRRGGALTDTATYEVRLSTDPTSIGVEGNGANIHAAKEEVDVLISGQAELYKDGTIFLKVADNEEPEVITGGGELDFSGSVDLEIGADNSFVADGNLDFKTKISNITGFATPATGLTLPVNFVAPDELEAIGSTGISLRNGTIKLRNGRFETRIDNEVSSNLLNIGDGDVELAGGRITGRGTGLFEFDGTHFRLNGTDLKLAFSGEDAYLNMENYKIRIDGLLKTEFNIRDGVLDSESGAAAALGNLGYSIDPRLADVRAGLNVGLFKRNVSFELKEDGTLSIDPGPSGLADFFAPFLKINGNQDVLVDPKSPAVAKVGSTAMQEHITALTGARVTTDNHVELLVDGVMSYPKRLEVIRNAKESISLQTLIFKDDETGMVTARALADAAKRGVAVRVIIDCLGNCENFDHLVEGRELYDFMREAGVEVALYNDPRKTGLVKFIDAIQEIPELREIKNPNDLGNPATAMRILNQAFKVATGNTDAPEEVRERVATGLIEMLSLTMNDDVFELSTGAIIESGHGLYVAKMAAEMNHRWHEKYLIADGNKSILGGMNIADEYMFGGTDRRASNLGIERDAWRDTDIYVEGSGARDAYAAFARNWETLRGEEMPEPTEELPVRDGIAVQVLQHRPRIDGDHNITNFMIENIKALGAGEKCYIENAYFIPTGALEGYKQALMDAAERGVDVRVITNSKDTTDAPQINQAAIFPYRDLLKAGVRIFERSDERCVHTKAAVFGSNTAAIGSWNADNRSASLNSESLVVAYDESVARQTEEMMMKDMDPSVATEVLYEDIASLGYTEELENSFVSILSDLM